MASTQMHLKLVSNMEDPQEPVREQANKINKASSSPWRFETNWNFQQFELLNLLDGLRRTSIFCGVQTSTGTPWYTL